MNILVVVTQSPYKHSRESSPESSLTNTARRFVVAATRAGHQIPAVFFHLDGVRNVIDPTGPGENARTSSGKWRALAANDTELLLCSSSVTKLFTPDAEMVVPEGFSVAGLVRMWDIAGQCERVVTF